MSEITLKSNFFHSYDGPNGSYWYSLDQKVIRHILDVGTKDFGYLQFIVDELGSSCYTRVRVLYDGNAVYTAQDTSSGDWWVSLCTLPINSKIWEYILNK